MHYMDVGEIAIAVLLVAVVCIVVGYFLGAMFGGQLEEYELIEDEPLTQEGFDDVQWDWRRSR